MSLREIFQDEKFMEESTRMGRHFVVFQCPTSEGVPCAVLARVRRKKNRWYIDLGEKHFLNNSKGFYVLGDMFFTDHGSKEKPEVSSFLFSIGESDEDAKEKEKNIGSLFRNSLILPKESSRQKQLFAYHLERYHNLFLDKEKKEWSEKKKMKYLRSLVRRP